MSVCLKMEQQNETKQQSRIGMLTAAGVLLIISSIIAMLGGLYYLYPTLGLSVFLIRNNFNVISSGNLFVGYGILILFSVFGILGFVFGLKAGIQTLKRKRFSKSIYGAILLLIYGLGFFGLFFVPPFFSEAMRSSLYFGTPITILSLLGLICLVMRKNEF
jgi:hypothetical protein